MPTQIKNNNDINNYIDLDEEDGIIENYSSNDQGVKYKVLLIILAIVIAIVIFISWYFLKRTWRLHCSKIETDAAFIVKNGPKKSSNLLINIASTSNWHYSIICTIIPLILYFIIVQFFPYPSSPSPSIEYISIELSKALLLLILISFTISKAITFIQVHCINPVGGPRFSGPGQ